MLAEERFECRQSSPPPSRDLVDHASSILSSRAHSESYMQLEERRRATSSLSPSSTSLVTST